jgi:hypothetical protein
MKKLLFLIFMSIFISCATERKSVSPLTNNEFRTTRRYLGNFVDYCHTGPDVSGSVHLIWIKTTFYNAFGKISAYGKSCDFSPGDKIYLRSISSTPDAFGKWEYQVENDSFVVYRVSDYRYENNSLLRASF